MLPIHFWKAGLFVSFGQMFLARIDGLRVPTTATMTAELESSQMAFRVGTGHSLQWALPFGGCGKGATLALFSARNERKHADPVFHGKC